MSSDKLLKLLKSGIWEDALIAFTLMKDWTMKDVRRNFNLEQGYQLDLGDSKHIQIHVQINSNLYMQPGGSWTIRFHEGDWRGEKITI